MLLQFVLLNDHFEGKGALIRKLVQRSIGRRVTMWSTLGLKNSKAPRRKAPGSFQYTGNRIKNK